MKKPFGNAHKKPQARQPRLMSGQDNTSFRRSRTLTGSRSSQVVAANEKRGELQSDRLKKQSLQRHQRLLFVGLSCLTIVIGGLYYLLSQYVGSVTVTYSAASTLASQPPVSIYATAITDYLGTRPAERFRFVLNEADLSTVVAKKYPEVRSIESDGGSIGNGSFIVTFRQATISWKIGQKQYFVDNSGETFEKNFYTTPTVKVTDNSGASVTDGSAVVSKGFLRFLGRLAALTSQSGLGDVTNATLPPNTTREIDITLKGRGYTIKTHTDRDPAAEVEDMQRVIAYLDQRKLNPVYIDIRVTGRAFYK